MKHKISILTKSDPRYPRKAGDLKDAPPVLYYQGALREIGNSVGIVGARRCSQKMKQKCVEIAQSYIRQGIAIVSGMAKGIDAYASTVCVNEGGYTIAVLGNGLDICYPAEHQPLMNRIREQTLAYFPRHSAPLYREFVEDVGRKYRIQELEIKNLMDEDELWVPW